MNHSHHIVSLCSPLHSKADGSQDYFEATVQIVPRTLYRKRDTLTHITLNRIIVSILQQRTVGVSASVSILTDLLRGEV